MKRKATILKSLRSEEGAQGYLEFIKIKHPDAFIVKSFGPDLMCDSAPPMGMAHVVIAQDLEPVIEAISGKDADEMLVAMAKAGFLEANSYGISLSSKFYDILNDFTKKKFETMFKSIDASSGVAQALEKQDLEGDEEEKKKVLDKVMKAVMSEEEASNTNPKNKGIGDGEAFETTSQESRVDGSQIAQPTVISSVPDAAGYTEAAVNNYEGDNPNESISETHPDKAERVDDNQNNVRKSEVYLFKSLAEGNQWLNRNPGYVLDGITFAEKKEHGKRYSFIARVKTAKEPVGAYGNRKR